MQSFSSYWKGANDFLAAASASDIAAKARAAAKDIAEVASKVTDTVQAEYRRTFVDLDCQIFTVRPDLLVMEFPTEDKIDRLATRLNASHAQRMMVFNMSERKYDTTKFQGEVVDVAFRGLPSPPLELLLELCLSAHHWLVADAGNVLVVHCFQGYSRSAVFLSCFMAFRGLFPNPVDALHEVCTKLGIEDKSAIVPSQRRYLTYFQQCQQGLTPPTARLRLQRAQLNGVPKFEEEGAVAFRPFIEVWNNGELVHSSLAAGAEEEVTLPTGFGASDTRVPFQFPPDTYVTADVLIRIRHVSSDGNRETAVRLAFHTGFVPDGFQLGKHELDSACADARFSEESFLDLLFERAPADAAEQQAPALPPPVYEKAREVARRLAEDERRRQEAEAAKAAAAGSPPPESGRDEFAELEEALRRGPGAGSSSSGSTAAPPPPPPAGGGGSAGADAAPTPTANGAELPASAHAAAPTPGPAAAAPTEPGSAAASAAPPPAPQPSTQAAGAESASRGASADIDDLFSEFDAALASVAGDSAGAAKSAAAPAAPAATAGEGAPKAEGATPGADDPFGDVDALFADIDVSAPVK